MVDASDRCFRLLMSQRNASSTSPPCHPVMPLTGMAQRPCTLMLPHCRLPL